MVQIILRPESSAAPAPRSGDFVEKKGLNNWARTSAVMPSPWSSTQRMSRWVLSAEDSGAALRVEMWMVPPLGDASRALVTRLL